VAAAKQPAEQDSGSRAADVVQLTDAVELNESQQAALEAAVRQKLTLIWGPPGTGKVSCCAACVVLTA